MTEMLDPWELTAHDYASDGLLTKAARERVSEEFDKDFPLGVACSINDEECESCQ